MATISEELKVKAPVPLDPQEELWFPVKWTKVFASTEIIQTLSVVLSDAAVTAGISILDETYVGPITLVKLRGGSAAEAEYYFEITLTTIDQSSRTRKRQKTIFFDVLSK